MVIAMTATQRIGIGGARLVLAGLVSVVVASSGVLAHAFLDHANPSVGSTVRGSPPEVKVWFTEALEPAFSNLRVVDQNGAQVDKQNHTIDPSDRTLLKVSLPTLPPGKYKALYHVLSVDTHTTEGSFTFEIAP
jgi:hypothetical protein